MRSHRRGLMSASIIAPPPDRLIRSTSSISVVETDGRGFAREAVADRVAMVVGAAGVRASLRPSAVGFADTSPGPFEPAGTKVGHRENLTRHVPTIMAVEV